MDDSPPTDSVLTSPVAAAPPSQQGSRWRLRHRISRDAAQSIGLLLFYGVLLAVFSAIAPHFANYANAINILSSVAVLGIVAIGQTVVIVGGGFDLSVAGVVPLASVVFVSLSDHPFPTLIAMAITLVVGLIVGASNAFVISMLNVNPIITTLASSSITSGLALTLSDGTSQGLNNLHAAFLANTAGRVPYFVILFIGLAVLAALALRLTVPGRSIYAVGGNVDAAEFAGIRVARVVSGTYIISALLAALAGIVVASQVLSSSGTVGADTGLQSATAVILGGAVLGGGAGGVPGTILGVLVLGTILNGMTLMQVAPFYLQIVTGVILIIAIALGSLQRSKLWLMLSMLRRPTAHPVDGDAASSGKGGIW